MAAKCCGAGVGRRHLMRALPKLVVGHWSLCPQCFTCSCVWVHYGLWLFHAAPANCESSSQPLSVMSTTLSGTMRNLVGSCLGCRRLKTVRSFLLRPASCHPCFVAPVCPGGLLHTQASPRKAQISPALGTLQSKLSFPSSSPGFGHCQHRRILEQ